MKKNKNAFTLIELLAVIVILAVILVIAIPRILDVIETSKKDSFKNAAQLIADTAEKKKVSDKLLGKDEEITCKDVAKINDEDYASCTISFDSEGNAKVSITGKGKFDGLKVCNATKNDVNIVTGECPVTLPAKATTYIEYLYNNEETRTSNGLKKDNTADQNIRYYGSDPNNYVSFNNELWRIIGVFGNNVKLVRSEKLGDLSWDSSESSINSGWGVNEWSQSDLKNYLNTMYYGGTSVTCYNGKNKKEVTCPTNTLDETSKSLIDYHTWNTGAPNYNELYNSTTKTLDTVEFYKAERGTVNGKICRSGGNCNDTVTRKTEWTGYIGLPYVTDWAYASSESICETRLDEGDIDFENDIRNMTCRNNNWINYGDSMSEATFVMTPYIYSYAAYFIFDISGDGVVGVTNVSSSISVFPSIYLKSNVLIESGNGSESDPYMLKLNS